MKTAGVILCITTGLVTGFVIGILFAPDKGSETRGKIAQKGEELTEEIKHKMHQFGEFISEKLDNTKGVYKNIIKTGNSII